LIEATECLQLVAHPRTAPYLTKAADQSLDYRDRFAAAIVPEWFIVTTQSKDEDCEHDAEHGGSFCGGVTAIVAPSIEFVKVLWVLFGGITLQRASATDSQRKFFFE
jgi:hypothetical protein